MTFSVCEVIQKLVRSLCPGISTEFGHEITIELMGPENSRNIADVIALRLEAIENGTLRQCQ